MIPIEYELEKLTKTCYDMFDIVSNQLMKCKKVLTENDKELAEDIIRKEIRVNALELNVERECENILLLKSPVAEDLRFVIAILKISESLERIGDHAFHIAEYIIKDQITLNKNHIIELKLIEMFDFSIEMINKAVDALENKDTKTAKSIFKIDKEIDKINNNSPLLIEKYITGKKDGIVPMLFVYKAISKMERVGDMMKNIAEEIIFYIESENVKHKKRNKKIFKTYIKE